MKSITQKSVSQFIRDIRLNKALELLKQSRLTVSEIAYQLGFNSPAYFNKCFHDQFGYPPGETKNHAEGGSESGEHTKEKKTININTIRLPSKLIIALIVMNVLIGSYLGYETFSNNKLQNESNSKPKSIVVLPLKTLLS